MMRLRSPALLRDLLWLSQTGTGGLSCCRRLALRWLHPAWPGVAGGRLPLRLMAGAAAAASRSLCTSSEGILEQTGKGPPAQQPPAPTTSAEMPASAPGQNSHNAAASKEAGGLGEK